MVEQGVAEIEGVPRGLRECFSVRRAEIVERASEWGAGSRRARQVAAYETRRAKDYEVPLERLREEWRARAAEHGLGERELAELLDRRRRDRLAPEQSRAARASSLLIVVQRAGGRMSAGARPSQIRHA